jgi:hypothetical protein
MVGAHETLRGALALVHAAQAAPSNPAASSASSSWIESSSFAIVAFAKVDLDKATGRKAGAPMGKVLSRSANSAVLARSPMSPVSFTLRNRLELGARDCLPIAAPKIEDLHHPHARPGQAPADGKGFARLCALAIAAQGATPGQLDGQAERHRWTPETRRTGSTRRRKHAKRLDRDSNRSESIEGSCSPWEKHRLTGRSGKQFVEPKMRSHAEASSIRRDIAAKNLLRAGIHVACAREHVACAAEREEPAPAAECFDWPVGQNVQLSSRDSVIETFH